MPEDLLSLLSEPITGEGAQRLVDQFDAALNHTYSSMTGSVGVDADGLYRSEVQVSSDEGRYPGRITWVLKRRLDGTVVAVTATGAGSKWRESAQDFFRQVLANALADKQEPFAHRRTFHYFGPHLAGEYWFGKVRVAPLRPDDDTPSAVGLERVVVIDHELTAPDRVKAYLVGDEQARRLGARVAFLLDAGLRVEERRQRWITVRQPDGSVEHVRGEGGVVTDHRLEQMPAKGEVCPMGRFEGSTHKFGRSGPLTFPTYSRTAWRAFDSATVAVRGVFDAMCQLYQVGLVVEEHYPSAALAYFVSAVEAASLAPHSGSNFGEFMRRFTPRGPDRGELIDRLYGKLRSGHFHSGRFPLGDFRARGTTFLGEVDVALSGDFYVEGRRLLRTALTGWAETWAGGAF